MKPLYLRSDAIGRRVNATLIACQAVKLLAVCVAVAAIVNLWRPLFAAAGAFLFLFALVLFVIARELQKYALQLRKEATQLSAMARFEAQRNAERNAQRLR